MLFDDALINDLTGLKEFEAHGKRWLKLLTISTRTGIVLAVEANAQFPAEPKVVQMPGRQDKGGQ